jgi:hypothetical protein
VDEVSQRVGCPLSSDAQIDLARDRPAKLGKTLD